MNPIRIMAVFAHPDDEAFGSGGTLARYAAEGCDVYLVTATRGEAGQIAKPDIASSANLPEVREQELRCACQIYGINPPIFLDYVDGQLTIVNQGQAVARLVRIIRDIKPQVLITFGQDGIYGHYDHIAVHRWTTIAANLAADPGCFPGQPVGECQPHRVDKVYFRAMTQEQINTMSKDGEPAAIMMDGVPFYFSARRDDEITTVIDVRDWLDQKMEGVYCHATQVGRPDDASETQDRETLETWLGQEHYVLVESTVGWPQGLEHDLLDRLR